MPDSFASELLKHVLTDVFTEILKPVARVAGQMVVESITFGKVRVAKFPKKKCPYEKRKGYLEIHPDIAAVLGAVIVIAALFGLLIWICITFLPPREAGTKPAG